MKFYYMLSGDLMTGGNGLISWSMVSASPAHTPVDLFDINKYWLAYAGDYQTFKTSVEIIGVSNGGRPIIKDEKEYENRYLDIFNILKASN